MSVSKSYFLNNAFAIHRYYFYHNVALKTRKIDDEEELRRYNREINLLSMFQFRMENDPTFQQHILSIIEGDEELFRRTGDYLKYLEAITTSDSEYYLDGIKLREDVELNPEILSNSNPKYVLYTKEMNSQVDYIDDIFSRENDADILHNLLINSHCEDKSVGWNTVILFANKRYRDGDFIQRLILDWRQYLSQNIKKFSNKFLEYDSLDSIFVDNTFPSNLSLNEARKKYRLTVNVDIPYPHKTHEDVRRNYFNGIQFLFGYRKRVGLEYYPKLEPYKYWDKVTTKEKEQQRNLFIEFTNDFLQTASELWFSSLSNKDKISYINKEYVFSADILSHDERSADEFLTIAEKIIGKGFRTDETINIAKKIYSHVLTSFPELPVLRRKYIAYRMNNMDKFRRDKIIDSVTPEITFTPDNGGHKIIVGENYSLLYDNPNIIDEKTGKYIRKKVKSIVDEYNNNSFGCIEDQEKFFSMKEAQIYEHYKYSNNNHPFPLLCLLSRMYIEFYWYDKADEWFNNIEKYISDFNPDEISIISQLKSDYYLKRGLSTKALDEMEYVEKHFYYGDNQSVLWEFWAHYANVSLQSRDFDRSNRCFEEILKLDPENPHYLDKIKDIKEYREGKIVISEKYKEITDNKRDIFNFFNEGDNESSLFYSIDSTDTSYEDVSTPLIQYSWGLDAFLGFFVWDKLYSDLVLSNIADDEINYLPKQWISLVGKRRKHNKPFLGAWKHLSNDYDYMVKSGQTNTTLRRITEYLNEYLGAEGIKKISDTAELLLDYRNDVCHANPVFMSRIDFYKKRKNIVLNLNSLIDSILERYMSKKQLL